VTARLRLHAHAWRRLQWQVDCCTHTPGAWPNDEIDEIDEIGEIDRLAHGRIGEEIGLLLLRRRRRWGGGGDVRGPTRLCP
jgi:hypothetical protein